MKTTGKPKFLAMIISVMMIVSMIPMGAFAVSATPVGEAINSAADFAAMAADGTYYLAADIELSETYANVFTGTFDGNGKTVTTSVPMFGEVENATIQNFTVTGTAAITTGANVTGGDKTEKSGIAIGAVACMATNSSFSQITNEVNISATCSDAALEVYCGGILGLMLNAADKETKTELYFTNCSNKGRITLSAANTNSCVGGIVGGCRFTAVEIVSIYVDGCKNSGDLTGPKCAGAIGYIQHTTVSISNSENSGNISATGMAGGMVSQMNGTIPNVMFENCRNTGDFSGGAAYVGGIVAWLNKGWGESFINCSNSGNLTSVTHAGGIVGGINGRVTGTFTYIYGCVNSGSVTGSNTVGGVIGLATKGNTTIEKCVNSGVVYSNAVANAYFGGIVAYIAGAGTNVVRDCANTGNIEVLGNVAGCAGAGGIAGHISNDTVENSYNTGNINAGTHFVGGLIGVVSGANTVRNCYVDAEVNGSAIPNAALAKGQIGVLYKTNSQAVVLTNNRYNSEKNESLSAFACSTAATVLDTFTTYTYENADLASGKLAYDINQGAGKTVFYQNINENGAERDAAPVLDPTHGYVFENGGKLYSLAFFTVDGASIRLDPVNHGIRFSTAVNKADYEVLTAAGIALDFGTVITPDEYLKAAGNDFTALAEGKYLDVNSTATGTDVFKEVNGEDNDTYYFVCGSVTGIKEANYDWDYSAIGYVTIGEATVYSANYTTRNAAYIANAAKNDPNGGYTAAELEIIESYIK